MKVIICADKKELADRAAEQAGALIRQTIAEKGGANILLATGTSQLDLLAKLVRAEGIEWSRVTGFHLDEYIGLPMSHPASLRRYLQERFVQPVPLAAFHYVNGEQEPEAECARLGALLRAHPIDVALVGIGENGHIAFNDPPADFETEEPYIIVELDEFCRRQQVREGWFGRLEEVPRRAISMSVRQIMKSRAIICACPEARKAEAVKKSVEGPVTPLVPASVLQEHPAAFIYLDPASAALLEGK